MLSKHQLAATDQKTRKNALARACAASLRSAASSWNVEMLEGRMMLDAVPSPWQETDLGSTTTPGVADYTPATQNYQVTASGNDIWDANDGFHYVYQPISGDFAITAKLSNLNAPDGWTKGGVMFRNALDATSRMGFVAETRDNGVAFQGHPTDTSNANQFNATATHDSKNPVWLKLVRAGDHFTGFYSNDGITFTQLGATQYIDMDDQVYVGLALTAHSTTATATADFSDVTLAATPVPSVPSNVTAKLSADGASTVLAWNVDPNAASYNVLRSTTKGGSYSLLAGNLTNPTYTDASGALGTRYYYVVQAVNATGASANSAELTTQPGSPVLTIANSLSDVKLSWSAAYNATGYTVSRGTSATGPFTAIGTGLSASTLTYTDTTAVAGTVYYYQVSANTSSSGTLLSDATRGQRGVMGTGTGIRGSYYSQANEQFPIGVPTVTRIDNNVDFNYGAGAPSGMPASFGVDHFVVRWAGTVIPQYSEQYTFYTASDDGVRLYIDGNLVINTWGPRGVPANDDTYTMPVAWNAGEAHTITLEYEEIGGDAAVYLRWSSPSTPKAAIPASQLNERPADGTSTVTATTNNNAVLLTWTPSSNATAYNVYRATTAGGPYTLVNATPLNDVKLTDTGLANGTTYYYVVKSINSLGEGVGSTEISAVPTPQVPGAPTGVAVKPSAPNQVTITWTATPFADNYKVLRASTAGGPYSVVADLVTGTSLADSSVTDGNTYYYVVEAHNAAGYSANSAEVSVLAGQGALGAYWDQSSPSNANEPRTDGAPGTIRVDANIDFDSGVAEWYPSSIATIDNTTVRWTGKVKIDTDGTYRFVSNTDDAGYLYVWDDYGYKHLVSKDPGAHGQRDATDAANTAGGVYELYVSAGWHDFQFDEGNGGTGHAAHFKLQKMNDDGTWGTLRVVTSDHLSNAISGPTPLNISGIASDGAVVKISLDNLTASADDANSNTAYGVQLQRSLDNNNWTTVSTTWADGIYEITDPLPPTAPLIYYRVVPLSYHNAGTPSSSMAYTPTEAGNGLTGRYYIGTAAGTEPQISGDPAAIRLDTQINFTGSGWAPSALPFNGNNQENFSAIWTGKINAPTTGTYRISVNSDDASYVFVDDQVASSYPGGHGAEDKEVVTPITLTAGWHNIYVLYAQGGGGYSAVMNWTVPGGTAELVPMDNLKPAMDVPSAATNLKVTTVDNGATLTWGDETKKSELWYNVEVATKSDFSNATSTRFNTLRSSANSYTYNVTGLAAGTHYYFRVTAANFNGSSGAVTADASTTMPVLPTAPTNLVSYRLANGGAVLNWTDNATNEASYIVRKRDITAGEANFSDVETLAANANHEVITAGLIAGHTYEFQIAAVNAAGESKLVGGQISAVGNGVQSPWASQVIGTVTNGGAVQLADGTFVLSGSGNDMWGDGDNIVFVYQQLTGDGMITARVPVFNTTAGWSKGGVVFRNDLTAGAIFSGTFDTGNAGTRNQSRVSPYIPAQGTTAAVGAVDHDSGYAANSQWVRIVRTGNVFTSFASNDGVNFFPVGNPETLTGANATMYVGLAMTSNNGNNVAYPSELEVNSVTVSPLAAPDATKVSTQALSPSDARVAWQRVSGATGYNVERATQANFSDATSLGSFGANATYLIDHSLNANTKYYYRVTATGPGGSTAATTSVTTLSAALAQSYTGNGNTTGWTLAGSANSSGDNSSIQLTNAGDQKGSAVGTNAVDLTRFKVGFDLYTTGGTGDGMTFAIFKDASNIGTGGGGGAMGYAGITGPSYALKFDIYDNIDKTSLLTDGVNDGGNDGLDLRPSNIDLNGAHLLHVDVSYDSGSKNLVQTITDITTGGTWTNIYANIDIPGHFGQSTGYLGFTAATGGASSTQQVADFTYEPLTAAPLVITGTANADTITVKGDGANVLIWVNHNPATDPADMKVALPTVTSISIDGAGSDDTIVLDFSGGNFVPPTTTLTLAGGAGSDTLKIVGTNGDDLVVGSSTGLTVNGTPIAPAADVEKLQLALGTGSNRVSVNSGTYTLSSDLGANGSSTKLTISGTGVVNAQSSQHLASLDVMNSGKFAFDATASRVLVPQQLNLVGNAVVDLNNNDLIMPYSTLPTGTFDVARPGDIVGALAGTIAGQPNAGTGTTPAAENVTQAIGGTSQKYLNFGVTGAAGLNTGFWITPSAGVSNVTGLRLFTANDAIERDPASYTFEGTNDDPTSPTATWSLISGGALALPEARNPSTNAVVDAATMANQTVNFSNSASFRSYRVLFPTLRGGTATPNSMQIGEVQLLGTVAQTPEQKIQTYVKNWFVTKSGPMIMASHASVAGFSQSGRTLAVFDNHDFKFQQRQANFDGEVFAANDFNQILVKYTYLGDANGDGKVDPTDYAVVDGLQGLGHSWITGDLNFDGKTSPDDYAQIDGNQGAGYGGAGGPQLKVTPVANPAPGLPATETPTLQLAAAATTDTGTESTPETQPVAQAAAPASPFSTSSIVDNSDLFGTNQDILA